MNILIIGATGGTGKQLVQQALERGHKVSVFVRNPSKLKISHPELKVFEGDILIPESISRACKDQDTVISALGHKRFVIPSSILSRGTHNLIAAMEENAVRRLICITALGIGDSRYKLGLYYTLFVHPFILFFYFRDKEKQERLIQGSNLDYTLVRPGQLTLGKRRERYKHGKGLGHYLLTKMISRADVAHFILDELEQPRYIHKVAEITY